MADPYRSSPAPRERFYFSSDGETFVDLDEVAVVFCTVDGDTEGDRKAEIWMRTPRPADDEGDSSWTLYDDDAREFMAALHAYRTGGPG